MLVNRSEPRMSLTPEEAEVLQEEMDVRLEDVSDILISEIQIGEKEVIRDTRNMIRELSEMVEAAKLSQRGVHVVWSPMGIRFLVDQLEIRQLEVKEQLSIQTLSKDDPDAIMSTHDQLWNIDHLIDRLKRMEEV